MVQKERDKDDSSPGESHFSTNPVSSMFQEATRVEFGKEQKEDE